LEAIYAHGNVPHIKHVYLGTLFHRDDLQAEVVGYLKKQKSFHDSPPPFGTWAFKGSGEIQKLVSEALLQSQFVTALKVEFFLRAFVLVCIVADGWGIIAVIRKMRA